MKFDQDFCYIITVNKKIQNFSVCNLNYSGFAIAIRKIDQLFNLESNWNIE